MSENATWIYTNIWTLSIPKNMYNILLIKILYVTHFLFFHKSNKLHVNINKVKTTGQVAIKTTDSFSLIHLQEKQNTVLGEKFTSERGEHEGCS